MASAEGPRGRIPEMGEMSSVFEGQAAADFPAFPPGWAELFGEDEAGIFAEFTVGEARFPWRWIPPGTFLMGSPGDEKGRDDDEGPPHEVEISRGFWLGETAVTQAQWLALMPENPSHFDGEKRPVEQVSWPDAMAFARELSGQVDGLYATLPSEAQWEYACRAGTRGAFHNDQPCTKPEGKDPALEPLGWYGKNSESRSHDVKGKEANAWGLYDMHGNVWEWCVDRWKAEAYRGRGTGAKDPLEWSDDDSAWRVVRGGSWYDRARNCRSACRSRFGPADRWSVLGFRLAAGQPPDGSGASAGPGAAEPPARPSPLGER